MKLPMPVTTNQEANLEWKNWFTHPKPGEKVELFFANGLITRMSVFMKGDFYTEDLKSIFTKPFVWRYRNLHKLQNQSVENYQNA